MKPLIFTDLDGSLLDHFTYEWQPAEKMLRKLQHANVPVIATTSKTHSEVLALKEAIPLAGSHIIENGAAILLPATGASHSQHELAKFDAHFFIKPFCENKEHWQGMIATLGDTWQKKIQTLSSMTIEEVVAATGLDAESAVRAGQRLFSEPVHFQGSAEDKNAFIEQVQNTGAHTLTGGRFIHVSGHCNKGIAMLWLKAYYERLYNKHFFTIAIGDGENDVAMLETADAALIIPSLTHARPTLTRSDKVYVASDYGPTGWSQGVEAILNDIDFF